LVLGIPNSKSKTNKKIVVRDWRAYSENALEQFICKEIEQQQSLEFDFEKSALIGLDTLAPFRVVKIREGCGHIISTKIEKWKKKRNRMFRKFRRTNNPLL